MSTSTPSATKPHRAHRLHGVLFMALFSFAAFYIADFRIFRDILRISPLIIGIVLGMLYANTLRKHLPEEWVPGIKFCSKTILRLSIIFYGFRLTLTDLISAGWSAIVVDILIVTSVLLLGVWIGRLLGLDRDTTLLVSSGSAICGAAAVLGTEPVLRADPSKTVVAVSTVVIFGTLAMFLYPLLYSAGIFHFSPHDMGIYTGSTLHEVAHVAGAGATMSVAGGGEDLAGIATITKMIRVILLAPFLLILAALLSRSSRAHSTAHRRRVTIPWFAIWFMVVIGINTLFGYLARSYDFSSTYHSTLKVVEAWDNFGLTMAMTALGCDAGMEKFKQAGARPFILALLLFGWLVCAGYFLTKYLVPLLG